MERRYFVSCKSLRMNFLKVAFVFFSALLLHTNLSASPVITFSDVDKVHRIGREVLLFEDTSNKLTINDIIKSDAFKPATLDVPNLGVTSSSFWIKFSVNNTTQNNNVLLEFDQPTIDEVDLYRIEADGSIEEQKEGEVKPYEYRRYKNQNHVFDLDVPAGQTRDFYMRLKSGEQLMFPAYIGTPKLILESLMHRDLIYGLFYGVMLVMLLYNLFIYFSVRDKGYLYYVVYILTLTLSQASLQGYAFRFLWPNSSWMAINSVYLFPSIAGLAAMVFSKEFLQSKEYAPKLTKGLNVLIVVFVIAILLVFMRQNKLSFSIMQLNTAVGSLYVLYLSGVVAKRGYKPAIFFLIAWSILLLGAIVFVMKDFGAVPYNNFTSSILAAGSAIEVILLSFALADKINILRKERELAQAETLAAVEENARIVREQNVILEAKVTERTVELKEANTGLSKALVDLKEAEMQLVESEKMASLGQLTAGIAHEINNPINFVTSNIRPLKRDVEMVIELLGQVEDIWTSDGSSEEKKSKIDRLKQDVDFDYLKTEIDYLLNGIADGSNRTAEIVKGLRVFSRLDEDDLKRADLNEGIDSTLVIVNNQINKTEVVKNYGQIPEAECYPGKLNQVFLNIMSNGLYAIKSKFKDDKGGIFTITTSTNDTHVIISFKDNGTGMTEDTKKKLFEPFFTTKEVGEGTGLGLSIAFNTIAKHNGTITVNSELGEGTEFVIEIPIVHQEIKM